MRDGFNADCARALKSSDTHHFYYLSELWGTIPPRIVHKIAWRDVFRHRSLVHVYKFPHVSSKFMDNLEPGSSLSQTSSVEFSRWMDRRRNSTGHVCGIKHTDENIPLSTVAVRLRHWIVREQCAIVPFSILSLSCFEAPSMTATARHCDMLHGADTGSTPSTGNPIKSKRIAPFIAESYELIVDSWAGPRLNSLAL